MYSPNEINPQNCHKNLPVTAGPPCTPFHVLSAPVLYHKAENFTPTIGEVLTSYLVEMWEQKECFNTKYAFDDEALDYAFAEALFAMGYIDGTHTDPGRNPEVDMDQANERIRMSIPFLALLPFRDGS